MALSAAEIKRVLAEIVPVLIQGRIQKIHQPADRVVLFEVRKPGETHRLLISCEPDSARLHLISGSMNNPPKPPSFCQFLRAHLQGGRIDDIRQLPDDRIVRLTVSIRERVRTLVAELTGVTANVVLLDQDGKILRDLDCQRQLVGQLYEPPHKRRGSAPSRPLQRFDAEMVKDRFPVSRAVEIHYHSHARALEDDRAKATRLRTLRRSLGKMLRRIEAWQEDLRKAAAYHEYARYGELLKANLQAIAPGMEQITVVDYYDTSLREVTLPLDRTKSALENMNEYFRRHRKHVAAERELRPRIVEAEGEVGALRREMTSIEQGTWIQPPAGVTSPDANVTSTRSPRREGPFRRFLSADGLPIYVGRNARENDELTFRLAKSDDLWLHARGTPGSHVVVRLAKGAEPPAETLRDAATLALLYSDLKRSGKGDVIYTKRKWVKKAKGQTAGAVTVTQEQTIAVKLDQQRLSALKARTASSEHKK